MPASCISQVLSRRALRACLPLCDLIMTHELWLTHNGLVVDKSSIAATTDEVLAHIEMLNGLVARNVIKKGQELSSLDFAALYPSVLYADLREMLLRLIRLCFGFALGAHNAMNERAVTSVYLKVDPYPLKKQAIFVFEKDPNDDRSLYLEVRRFISCWSSSLIFRT